MNGFLIGIEPILLRVGPVTLRWSGLLVIIALLVGVGLTWRSARKAGFSAALVIDLLSWVLPTGFLGARGFNLLENWEYYLTRPIDAADPASGGLNFWGALFAGGITTWIYCRRRRLGWARLADAAAPGLAVADAVVRVGQFLDGDGQGRPAASFWATRYSSAEALTPDLGVPRHPAQLYQGFADLAILELIWLLRDTRLPNGAVFWLWLGMYGLSRLALGIVRVEPAFLLGLQQAQLMGLAAITLSIWAMIRLILSERVIKRSLPG